MNSCMIEQFLDEQIKPSFVEMNLQEAQLYDYLLMKFITITLNRNKNRNQVKQSESSQFIYQWLHKEKRQNILSIFVRNQVQNKKRKHALYQSQQSEQQSFLKKLIQRYPSVFQQILREQQITWEDIVLNVIRKGSLRQIFSLQNSKAQFEKFNIKNPLINSTIKFYFESLFYDKKMKEIKSFEIVEHLKSIVALDFKNFYKNVESFQVEKIKSSLFQCLETVFSNANQLKFDETSIFREDYQNFEEFYKVEETQISSKIFELHYVQQLLQNSESIEQDSKFFPFSVLELQIQNQNNATININFFNVKISQNSQKLQLNKKLLKSFINSPYQTSLFVLYKLLSSSELKDTKKFFDNSKSSSKFIDPLMWLFVKKQLINALNIEAVSLSLWIMTDIWLQFIEEKATQRVKISKDTLLQAQKVAKLKDPRKIYAINQQAYASVQTPMNGSTQKPLISSIEEFENTYKRPLMHTVVMWLLSLNVESTMLKYYCIENDLLKEMSQRDILPTLLTKNQYLFNSKGVTAMKLKHQKNLEQEFEAKIMSSKSMEELKQLEESYRKSTVKKDHESHVEKQFSCFQQQSQQILPWLQIIQSKQFLFPLLSKPSGYELILHIIQKNPRLYIKLYESYLLKMICSEIEKKNYEEMTQNKENHSADLSYKFQGNKNAKPKKDVFYFSQSIKQLSAKVQNIEKSKCEKQRKFDAMKKIVYLFKSNTKDENLKLTCNQLLKYL